jgi:phage-related protein
MPADDELLLKLKFDPDLATVDAAVAMIGQKMEGAGVMAGNAAVKALAMATRGVGTGALAGGIAGHRLSGGTFGTLGGALGGGLGSALGPEGTMIGGAIGAIGGGAMDATVGQMGRALGSVGGLVTGSLSLVARSLHALEEPLGPLALGLNLAGEGLEKLSSLVKGIPVVGSLLGPLTDALAGVPGILKDITGTLISFAAKVSPGIFKQLQLAVESVQATIGQAFVPVMELIKDAIGDFADVLANLIPNTTEVYQALEPLRAVFAEMAKEMKAAAAEVGPAIRQGLIEALRQLAHWAAVAVKVVGLLAGRLKDYFALSDVGKAGVLDLLSGKAFGVDKEQRERTLPAGPAQITGFAEYQRQLQISAFSQGTQGKSIQEQQLDAMLELGKIDEQARAFLEKIDKWATETKQWWDENWPKLESGFAGTVSALGTIKTAIDNIHTFLTQAKNFGKVAAEELAALPGSIVRGVDLQQAWKDLLGLGRRIESGGMFR